MKISVLMPTYNCPPELLEKAILSVMLQWNDRGWVDFEIVIKDGNVNQPAISYPNVKNLIESLGPKVKYSVSSERTISGFYQHNGFYEALNQCINASTGDILSILCSDDEYNGVETFLHVHKKFTKHGKSPFVLYGACEWINFDGSHKDFKKPPIVPVTHESLLNTYTLYTPSLFWNRAVHDKFGLFDESYSWCADFDFWLRAWRGIDTEFTPEVLGRYRVWSVSQCARNWPLLEAESERIREKHREG